MAHATASTLTENFTRPSSCNMAATGNITDVESCSCGATRRTDINQVNVGHGDWMSPSVTDAAERLIKYLTAKGYVATLWSDGDASRVYVGSITKLGRVRLGYVTPINLAYFPADKNQLADVDWTPDNDHQEIRHYQYGLSLSVKSYNPCMELA